MDRIGEFRLIEKIASGGMGAVFLARDRRNRPVALKVLHRQLATDSEQLNMFLDEIHIGSALSDPHVVSTRLGAREPRPFLVMDYVDGVTLAQLRRHRPLSTTTAVQIIRDVLKGLDAIHNLHSEHGEFLEVVHRDITPDNILVGRDGLARICDLGVAKARERLAATSGLSLKGKLPYMAPEYLRRSPVDCRVDLFAAGVCLWEALAHQSLFRGGSAEETIGNVLSSAVLPPSEFRSGAEHLDRIVLRALERNPQRRFQSATEFLAELPGDANGRREVADAVARAAPDRPVKAQPRAARFVVGAVVIVSVGAVAMLRWC